jgi:hypothetical protein
MGSLPDKLDIWRISPAGGTPERITSHDGRVIYPVLLDRRTLIYLASDPDGSGPWLYSMDVERRIPHPLTSGLDRYTSLAASADGHRLVLTTASPKRTLCRLRIDDSPLELSVAAPVSLITGTVFSPRLGPNYLLYVSATGASESIWKLANGTATELWSGLGVQVVGGPAIASDGQTIGISVARNRGIRAAKGSILLFVEADCRLEPNCLAAVVSTISASPQHNCFQLSLTGICSTLAGRTEHLRLTTLQGQLLEPDGRIRYVNTAGFAIRRSSVSTDAILFDPVSLRGEDTLLLADLIERDALPLFVDQAIVRHEVPSPL